jgi:integrase/recombinase XerD
LLEAFLQDLQRRRYSESLLAQARGVLPPFLSYLRAHGRRDLRGVREEHIESYARRLAHRKTRCGRPLAVATQLVHLSVIRRFFRFLARGRFILADPTKDLTLPRYNNLPRAVLSLSQARALMGAPHRYHGRWWWPHVERRDHAILELLYGTGIRRGECVRLELADVDLAQGQLLVRNGKGRKDRLAPIPSRAAQALDIYLKDTRPVFVKDRRITALFTSYSGGPLKPITLAAMLKRRAKAAGLPLALSPHVLRHSCATHLLKGGADVRHVQQLLGHAHLDSTVRYTHVAIRDLSKAIERSHPREREWARKAQQAR